MGVQYWLDLNTCYTGTIERFCQYILEQSAAVRAVSELFVGETGATSNILAKLRPRFAYQWPDS